VAGPTRLAEIVATSNAVRETSSRLEKRARLQELFARLAPADLRLAASYLAGETARGSVQVGWSTLVAAEKAVAEPDVLPLFANVQPAGPIATQSPTLVEVDRAFETLRHVSGAGATKKKQAILQGLMAPMAQDERRFLGALLVGELRQGALRALVLEAVADAFAVEVEDLRRAVMFAGSLGVVLERLASEGAASLADFAPHAGVPVEPMLAAQAEELESALQKMGERVAVDRKQRAHRRSGACSWAASDAPLREGDFVLVDLWAKLDKPRAVYSDLTRVGFIGTTVPQKYADIFRIVASARDAAIARIQSAFAAGEILLGWQVDEACREVITKAGYGEAFVHRTGHSIGQETHGNGANMDNLETHEERRVLRRTCFSVEPGIYLPEFGVRSEVNVFIDGGGQVHVTGGELQRDVVAILAGA
jgi:hypothetical protein